MFCPFCQTQDTCVIDSRLVEDGLRVKRRRECLQCQERFTTHEAPTLALPRVIKRNGQHTVFDQEKLRTGILRALEKRPVSITQIDSAIALIERKLRESGDREIHSKRIGEHVMDALKALDQVAYVRFASVYRSFQDIDAFHDVIERLKHSTTD